MKSLAYKPLTLLLALMPAGIAAQNTDLTDKALDGLELYYLGNDPTRKGVEVFSDLTYWSFFTQRIKGWNGGLGASSTRLPDGNTFWAFNDSYFGLVTENRARTKNNNKVRNAAMIQTGEESEDNFLTLNSYVATNPASIGSYYKGKTWLRHPSAQLSDADINRGKIDADAYFTLGDALVVRKDGKLRLQVLCNSVDTTAAITGTAVAEYALDGEAGETSYMEREALTTSIQTTQASFGYSILEDSGYVYIYGTVPSGSLFGGVYPVVARTQKRDLCSQWAYYIKDANGNWDWQLKEPSLEDLQRSSIAAFWASDPTVFQYGGKYYLCLRTDEKGSICLSQADKPYGPFQSRRVLYKVALSDERLGNLHVHPQLSREGELVVSYATSPSAITVYTKGSDDMAVENNIDAEARNFTDWESADLTQPHFLRCFNWQKLMGVENVGPTVDSSLASLDNEETAIGKVRNATDIKVTSTRVREAISVQAPANAEYDWNVYNMAGTQLLSGKARGNAQVSVSALASGIYFVTLRNNNFKKSYKIIKY